MPPTLITIAVWLTLLPIGRSSDVDAARAAFLRHDDAEAIRLGEAHRNAGPNAEKIDVLAIALRAAGRQRAIHEANAFGLALEDALERAGRDPAPDVAFALGAWHRDRPNRRDELDKDRLVAALHAFDAAVQGYRGQVDPLGAQDDPALLALANALEFRGNVASRVGQHSRGVADVEEALEIHDLRADAASVSRCLLRTAYAMYLAGEWEESLRHLDRHRAGADATGGRTYQLALRDNELLRALCMIGSRRLSEAATAIRREFHHDELLLGALGIDELLQSYSRSMISTGEVARALLECWNQYPSERTRAFAMASGVFEHGSAKILRHVLAARSTAAATPGADPLADADPDSSRGPGPPTSASLTPVLPEHYSALPDGMAEIRYGEIETADRRAPRYVILARYRDEQVFEELGAVDTVNEAVTAFMMRWFEPAALSKSPTSYAQDAERVRRQIFGSAETWFAGSTPPRRVLILGTGVFGRFPWGALLTPRVPLDPSAIADRGYASLPFLIRSSAFLQAPNLDTLTRLPAPNDARGVVAVLDPAVVDAHGRQVPSLRFAARELEGLRAAHGPVRLLTREEATVRNILLEIAKGDLRWLHIGCHATPDEDARNRAALLTARKTRDAPPLRVTDVFRTPITVGCRVVLSACGTSSGDVERGEGILGLWRAFLVAGAACVVSTLYEVDDRAIGSWMAAFHLAAATGIPLAEAQQRACLGWLSGEHRPRWPRGAAVADAAHPYLWAGTVCLGNDGGPLPKTRSGPP